MGLFNISGMCNTKSEIIEPRHNGTINSIRSSKAANGICIDDIQLTIILLLFLIIIIIIIVGCCFRRYYKRDDKKKLLIDQLCVINNKNMNNNHI